MSDLTDLTTRLRNDARSVTAWPSLEADFREAADRIVAQAARIVELESDMATMHRSVVHDCCVRVQELEAQLAAIDALHQEQRTARGVRFCPTCLDDAWPCRTHLIIHPEEAHND